jgi:hypothetical protein
MRWVRGARIIVRLQLQQLSLEAASTAQECATVESISMPLYLLLRVAIEDQKTSEFKARGEVIQWIHSDLCLGQAGSPRQALSFCRIQ